MLTQTRCYTELSQLVSFDERYEYLRLTGKVGESSFGFDRWVNQRFYRSNEWLRIRDLVIVRDNACDLGVPDNEIFDRILVHHMNPVRPEDLEVFNPSILNPEFLISISFQTHQAIHFGNADLLPKGITPRYKNDTCPWRS